MRDQADDLLVVYCTCPDRESGEQLATRLVEDRLAACVNLIPGITSLYVWNEALQQDSEVLLVIKTTSQKYPKLEGTLKTIHPYEVPEIIATPIVAGATAYLDWVRERLGET
ncbi:MAG: divalent-cation tolerance protein CutA [Gammaproteobacteria bacterium]